MHWSRQQWAETFTGDHKLTLLDERGPVALFKSQRWTLIQHNAFGDGPIYTVWDGDEMIYCRESYKEAYNKLEGLINGTATLAFTNPHSWELEPIPEELKDRYRKD